VSKKHEIEPNVK